MMAKSMAVSRGINETLTQGLLPLKAEREKNDLDPGSYMKNKMKELIRITISEKGKCTIPWY